MRPRFTLLFPAALALLGGCEMDPIGTPGEEAGDVVDAMTDKDGTWKDAGAEIDKLGQALKLRKEREGRLSKALDELQADLDNLADGESSKERQAHMDDVQETIRELREDLEAAGQAAGEHAQIALDDVEIAISRLGDDLDELTDGDGEAP